MNELDLPNECLKNLQDAIEKNIGRPAASFVVTTYSKEWRVFPQPDGEFIVEAVDD